MKRSVKITNLHKTASIYRGLFWSGEYGFKNDIVDTKTGGVSYKKKETDADPTPFYFEFRLPPNEDRGLLIVQKSGTSGIKGLLDLFLTYEFTSVYTGYKLDINSFVPVEILKGYIATGKIEEIKLVKHEIPADIADKFGGDNKAYAGSVEMVVRPSKASFFSKDGMVEVLEGKRSIDTIYPGVDFQHDTVKATININGRSRTIDISKPVGIRTSIDISNTVVIDSSGYPEYNSLVGISDTLIKDMAKKAGIVL